MHLQPQTLLQGRYRIHQLIAQGGMGAVYQATDERLGNTVALKQTLVSDPQLRAAFEREARLLAGMHHPALPLVSDHFAEGSEQFLVMQFIPGDDLAALLKQRGAAFPLAEVLPWAERLLDALDYLHTRTPPIIHRDIKPQNLKLTARGELMLLDFGLAKGAAAASSATQGLSVFGYTPQYAPIEQIQGAGTDARSDLYAVGATLYELLTGQPPADALTRAAATVSGSPDPLQPAHTLSPQLPASVGRVLQHALALAPHQRPAGAAALRAELRAALAPPPQPILPVGPAPSSAGQPTVMVAQGSSAGQPTIMAQQGAAAQPTMLAQPTGAPARAARGRPRSRRALAVALLALALAIGLALAIAPLLMRPAPGPVGGGAGGIVGENPIGGAGPGGAAAGVNPAALPGLTRQNPLPPDDAAQSEHWQVRVLEVQRGDQATRALRERPPAGFEFVLVRVQATRTAPGDPDEFEVGDIGLVGAQQVIYGGFAAVAPAPRLIDVGPVGRGDASEGWAVFQVQAGEPNLLLVLDELLADDRPPQYIALSPGAALRPDPALAAIDPTALGADRREPAALGELVITEDWEITVRQLYRGAAAWERIVAGNQFNKPAAAGFEFVLAEVAVRYIGDADAPELIFASYFTGVDQAGAEVDQPSVVEPEPELYAKLFPGGATTGWVAVAVPTGDQQALLAFKATSIGLDADSSEVRYFALGPGR